MVQLLKGDAKLVWNDKCDRAFKSVKELLLKEPILTLPNNVDPYILAVDFSYQGMGMVFS